MAEDTTAAATADDQTQDQAQDDLAIPGLGDKGKEALKAEREARKAEKARADAAQAELDRIRSEAAAAQTAKDRETEAARIKADEERGAYDEAKAAIEKERDDARADAQAHLERLTAALDTIKPGVETRWTDLPDEVKALYDGDPEDVLAKAAHLDKTAPLVARLTTTPAVRVGVTPRPTDKPTDKDDDEARRAQARGYKDF